MRKILITGRNSYVTRNFIDYANKKLIPYSIDTISVRDDSWKTVSFKKYTTIIHTAALVHLPSKKTPPELYEEVNHYLTIALAKKAKKDGVSHFLFLSTINVYGLKSGHINTTTIEDPDSSYSHSKLKAENALKALSTTDFKVTIIRAPMIYGPNCKGNFRTLYEIANISPVFPKTNNERSAIFIDNLMEFFRIVIDEEIGGILFPQNNEYFNTSKTVSLLAQSASKKIHLSKIAGFAVSMLMFSSTIQKAFGNLSYSFNLPGGPRHLEYNKVNYEESIKMSAHFSNSKTNKRSSLAWQRLLDIVLSFTGLVVTSPLLLGTTLVGSFDTGSPLFIQERVGKHKKPFKLVKFRTMKLDTASVASHLADNSSITKLGRILRKTKLDELPQLINVLKGDMSLVGPRPNLYNQHELIEARDTQGVYDVLPGITGLAQLSGIDMSTPELLAKTDKEMIDNLTLKKYFSYIIRTALGKGSGDAVK